MNHLADAIDDLAAVDPRSLSDEALSERSVALRTAINRLESLFHTDLEVLDRRGGVASQHGSTQAWVRSTHRVSGRVASRMVHLARDLADVMPATGAALAAGAISVAHAQAIAALRRDASDDSMRTVEVGLADVARTTDADTLRSAVTAVRHSLQPEAVVRDESRAYEMRELYAATTFQGTGVGQWTLDPVSQEKVMTAIRAASRPIANDDRTAKQRRADALITICEFFTKHAEPGDVVCRRGAPPQVSVVVSWETLTGQRVTGPNSEILDVGRGSRTFTAAAAKAIVVRDRHCRWPGCDAPPSWCEAHHAVHWADGGPSDLDNGVLLCGRHHDRVHHGRHAIVIEPDGSRTVCLEPLSGDSGAVRDRRSGGDVSQRAGP